MTTGYAVVVNFELRPEADGEFLRLVRENAAQSVALEPGCHRFDVVTLDEPGRVMLYEIYADRAAFDAHLASSHFGRFDAETRELVASKRVTTGSAVINAKEGA